MNFSLRHIILEKTCKHLKGISITHTVNNVNKNNCFYIVLQSLHCLEIYPALIRATTGLNLWNFEVLLFQGNHCIHTSINLEDWRVTSRKKHFEIRSHLNRKQFHSKLTTNFLPPSRKVRGGAGANNTAEANAQHRNENNYAHEQNNSQRICWRKKQPYVY